MKKIYLTGKNGKDKFALVDDEDFEKLNEYNWFFCNGYASKHNKKSKHNNIQFKMHRFIMNCPKNLQVDHINGNKLDNRRKNLRICTLKQNCRHKGFSKNNTSGYKGVYWDNTHKYWVAKLEKNRKIYAFYFKDKLIAAKKYNELALKYHGEFALINKI